MSDVRLVPPQNLEAEWVAPGERPPASPASGSSPEPRDQGTPFLVAALACARRGWPVLMCKPGRKEPEGTCCPHGLKDATTDESILRTWWRQVPTGNVAVVTGARSRLAVLDLDVHGNANGIEVARARFDFDPDAHPGPVQRTGGGGLQAFFAWLPGARNRTGAGAVAEGVELKGEGGYVVVPPSVHPSGNRYEWTHAPEIEGDLPPLPAWLLDGTEAKAVEATPSALPGAGVGEPKHKAVGPASILSGVPQGQRNDSLFKYACRLRTQGLAEVEAANLVGDAGTACSPPYPDSGDESIEALVSRVFRTYPGPAEETADTPTLNSFHTTDSGNAEAFAWLFGNRLRFDHRQERWLVFRPGLWWTEDADGELGRLVLGLARARQRAAVECDDADGRKELTRWALGTEARFRQQAALEIAKSVRPIADDGSGWDADPWLLGVANGVLDLREGTLRPGKPEDRVTMHTPIAFDPDATCPRWERFLEEVFSEDADVVAFVHRLAGYTLTGSTREQVFVVLHGHGENGKSTFLAVLRHILGPFAHDSGFGLFERPISAGPHPEALAETAGKRLVTASETGERTKLNEQRIKILSHGDATSARFLHRDRFEFTPEAKIFLGLNHRPRVEDDSRGFWRSALLVPFLRRFQGAAADRDLDRKLLAEARGVLLWAVRGCLAWQRDGLCPPDVVLSASAAWQAECDPVAAFLMEACIEGEYCQVSSADLYRAYLKWCESEALPERERLTHTAFGRRIGERYHRDRVAGTGKRVYLGIGLKTDTEDGSIPF